MTLWQVCDTLLYAQLKRFSECFSFMSVFSLAVVTIRYMPTVLAAEDQMLAVLH